MTIQILGGGCPNCEKLAANATRAADQLELDYSLEKITDFAAIAAMGVLQTPALAVDGTVLQSGRVADIDECRELLAEAPAGS
jgi:small redox-active disulfide protein 2